MRRLFNALPLQTAVQYAGWERTDSWTEILISCQAGMGRAGCVLEEFKRGIVFARMLLR